MPREACTKAAGRQEQTVSIASKCPCDAGVSWDPNQEKHVSPVILDKPHKSVVLRSQLVRLSFSSSSVCHVVDMQTSNPINER